MNKEDKDKSHSTGALFGADEKPAGGGTSKRDRGKSESVGSTIDFEAFARLPQPGKQRRKQFEENQSKRELSGPMSCDSSVSSSDVSSEGDAASIVSRLSQIVVEEECKLQEKFAQPETSQPEVSRKNGFNKSNQAAPVNYNFVKSSFRKETNTSPEAGLVGTPAASEAAELVPKIKILSSAEDDQARQNRRSSGKFDDRHSRQAKSNSRGQSELSCDIGPASGMRRNESSGFLPERGDLRRLESFRNKQQQENFRNRSNTTSNLDRSKILANTGSDLVLNIKRSAWKLSDFDKTFELNQANESSAENSPPTFKLDSRAGSFAVDLNETGNLSLSDKPTSVPNKLFNSSGRRTLELNYQQHPVASSQQVASSTAPTNVASVEEKVDNIVDSEPVNKSAENYLSVNKNNNRRSSNAQSITSATTSVDSFYHGLSKRINKVALARRRRRAGNDGPAEGEQTKGNSSEENCCRSCFSLDTFGQFIPILEWLPNYKSSYFFNDLTGGCVVAIMNISTCISAAVVAETDLSVAFRASIINTFIYSILCSSRHTSFGSWSIMSQMLLVGVEKALNDEYILDRLNLGTSLSKQDYDRWHYEVIIMYTFSIGLIQLVCGLLNLGSILSSFIPEALCSSLIAGTAITMAFSQLANMMGTTNKILIATEKNMTQVLFNHLKEPPVDITDLFAGLFGWVKQFAILLKHYQLINPTCAIISIVALLCLILNQYVLQRQLESLLNKKILIPFEMILVIIAIPVTYYFELNTYYQVPTCGPIKTGLVMPNMPDVRLIRELWDQSLATALISYTMTYIMAKSYGNKLNYEVDFNQELIACGAGNLVGGLFDALPATASFVRTAGNVEAGGKTQMSGIINCLMLLGVIQLCGSYAEYLPVCLMSTCLFFGFLRLMTRTSDSLKYWRICKVDFAIWAVSFLAILTTDIVNGFVYGFIFTIFTMLYRAQNRRCYILGTIDNLEVYVPLVKYPLAKEIPGIKIFQFCGPIHYVCADLFEHLLRQKTRVDVNHVLKQMNQNEQFTGQFKYINHNELNLPNHIILDFSMISYIDSAGIHIIKKIIEDYQQIGVTILIASPASHVAAVIKSDPSLWNTYKDRFYVGLADAVHCALRDNERNQQRFNFTTITGTMQPPAIVKMIEE